MVLAHFRVRARVFLLLWHCSRWFARWRVFVEGGARLLYVPPPVSREGRARLARRACFWGGRKNFFLLCFSFASRYVCGRTRRKDFTSLGSNNFLNKRSSARAGSTSGPGPF